MPRLKEGIRIFFPTSSQDYQPSFKKTQRYRHPFGDKRLDQRIKELERQMVLNQSLVINQLSTDKSEKATFYNVLNNDYVDLGELINYSCKIKPSLVENKSLLVLLDTSSTSLTSYVKEKRKQNPMPGVVGDNSTPGFYIHPSLVLSEKEPHLIGIGDIVFFDRPKNNLKGKEQVIQGRTQRSKLPLEEKESSVWSLCAANTHKQLEEAKEVTYVLDQGGDMYPTLVELRKQTQGAHFLVRSKENRLATNVQTGQEARLKELLSIESWQDLREVTIRGLDHYSKTKGKQVIRQARTAKLKIRFIEVDLGKPSGFKGAALGNVSIVEVEEDSTSIPQGEEAIHWRLITTRQVNDIQSAWEIIRCYQIRWYIEQLFRIYKKQGFDIESSQFKNPNAIKKQAVLGLKAASQVLQLTMARSGEDFISIQTMFDQAQQIEVLTKVNEKLSGKTDKTTNPHQPSSLAWAAWIIARLGGWNGYQKAREPGPITMHRGLKKFYDIIWANNLMNGP